MLRPNCVEIVVEVILLEVEAYHKYDFYTLIQVLVKNDFA